MPWVASAEDTPYAGLGGRDAVIALAQTFYDVMERDEVARTAGKQGGMTLRAAAVQVDRDRIGQRALGL